MEQVHGTPKASKFEPQDFISGMPDDVITNILDRLPIRDAVKTDALSKKWKFKWTLLTRLIFNCKFFNLRDKFVGKIISRLLLHLKGPITKFVLHMTPEDDEYMILDHEDIRHWVMFLSRRGIKEFTLKCFYDNNQIDLPTQLYSCMELKYLKLHNVYISSLPSFHGFPNLLSLHLTYVEVSEYTVGEFIARCPLLEILSYSELDNACELGLSGFSKLGNLKILSWSVCMDDPSEPSDTIKSSSFYELTALPKLQELNLDFGCGEFVAEAGVDKKVSAVFICLKTLRLSSIINFSCDIFASFVLKMICNSPNLETLNITGGDYTPSAVCSLDLGCNTMKQLQLRSVSFSSFKGSKNDVCLIKFILASSPLLKKFVISVDQYLVKEHAEFAWRMAGKLLNLHRASPIVEIELF